MGSTTSRRGSGRVLAGRRERARDPRGAWPTAGAETVQALHARGARRGSMPSRRRMASGGRVRARRLRMGRFPDLALSAEGGGVYFQGESYVVFGGPDLASTPGPTISQRTWGPGCASSGRRPTTTPRTSRPRATSTAMGSPTSSSPLRARLAARLTSCSVGRRARSGSGTWETTASAFSASGTKFLGVSVAGGGDFTATGWETSSWPTLRFPPLLGSLYIVFGQGPVTSSGATRTPMTTRSSSRTPSASSATSSWLGAAAVPRCRGRERQRRLDITDAIFILEHLFLGGAAPPAPIRTPGSTSPRMTYDADERHEIANLDGCLP